jgi:hypothetical protein
MNLIERKMWMQEIEALNEAFSDVVEIYGGLVEALDEDDIDCEQRLIVIIERFLTDMRQQHGTANGHHRSLAS